MIIPILATAIRLLWISIEYPSLRRFRIRPAKDWDRHSAKFWDAANGIEIAGMVLGFAGIGRFQSWNGLFGIIGLSFLIVGYIVRGAAIKGLGKYFTGTVLIKNDHQLIRAGLYRHVRHPAYAGTLLAHLGLGLSFANWFTLVFSTVPFMIAAVYRMHVEERALTEKFGEAYAHYSSETRRLIPKVY